MEKEGGDAEGEAMGRTAVWGCAGIGGRRRVMWSAGDGKKAVKVMSAVGTRHLAFRCERVVYNVALLDGLGDRDRGKQAA